MFQSFKSEVGREICAGNPYLCVKRIVLASTSSRSRQFYYFIPAHMHLLTTFTAQTNLKKVWINDHYSFHH